MAETTSTAPVSADPVHQEGIDHIKENVGETTLVATSAGTEGATDFTPEPVVPVSATEPETTTSAVEPTPAAASHTETSAAAVGTAAPAETTTAAAAPAAAAVGEATPATTAATTTETPAETAPATSAGATSTPTNQKRKSIIGSFKGMLGLADGEQKKSGERKRSLADRGKGSSTTTEPAAAAATTTTSTPAAGGEVAKDSTAAEAETAAADNKAVDPKTDTSVAGTETAKTEDADESKPKTAAGQETKALEHKEAIPEAGGEKLGEKHWGESKIIPPDPKTQETGVASADGQPTDEVKDNTAQNTGSASTPATGEKKKEKFVDRMKEKLKMGKK